MKTRCVFFTMVFAFSFFKGLSQRLELEAVAGPSLSYVRTGSRGPDQFSGKRLSVNAGLGLNYRLSTFYHITTGLYYEQKGAVSVDASSKTRLNYAYLTLPLQLSHRFGDIIKYQIGAGLYVSYRVSERLIIASTHRPGPYTNVNLNNGNPLDFGLAGFAALYIPMTNVVSIKISAQGNWGTVDTHSVVFDPYARYAKHSSLALLVGVNYPLR
ncbi:outer membrane beta-barrel protein [Chryseolinea soli]|uniref:PorT family protein n=1 Tax=Chryseolinea soli TaxID=2321403 RepID=A0A385SU09_9BACT|nr:outer membrane beta-barrel protein [Chryseolinea soli]AYB34026.1 PorT family protein [Chryseolinea soli]